MEDNLIGLDLLVNNKKIKKQKKDNIFEKEIDYPAHQDRL